MNATSSNWIVVVAHGNLDLLVQAIASFESQDVEGGCRILVVNNESPAEVRTWLAQRPEIVTINHYPQHSVARAWNAALGYLFSLSGSRFVERVLVCNSDVVLRSDTFRWLEAEQADFVTAVGSGDPKCVKPHEPRPTMTLIDNMMQDRMRMFGASDGEVAAAQARVTAAYSKPWFAAPDPEAKRPHPDFSCYMISRWCYEHVGPFDENFKLAFVEDSDYHVRMHLANILAYSIDLPFYHVGGGSQTIKRANEYDQAAIQKQAAKNRAYFAMKWGFEVPTPENKGTRYYKFFGTAGPRP